MHKEVQEVHENPYSKDKWVVCNDCGLQFIASEEALEDGYFTITGKHPDAER